MHWIDCYRLPKHFVCCSVLTAYLQHGCKVVAGFRELRIERDSVLVSVDGRCVVFECLEHIAQIVVGLGKLRIELYRANVHFGRFRQALEVLIDQPEVVARRPEIRDTREHGQVALRSFCIAPRRLMLERLLSKRAQLWGQVGRHCQRGGW